MIREEKAIYHISDSGYCFASAPDEISLRLRMSRDERPLSVKVIYGGKYDFAHTRETAELQRRFEDGLFSYYTAKIKLSDVRFVYVFYIETEDKAYYYSEDGLSETYDFTLSYYNSFQMPYINKIDVLNRIEWTKNAVFYQIFVDRFFIGDEKKGRSYVNMEWGGRPTPYSFAGGDLKGIEKKLDYIRALGANALYLTPIFKAPSNHKYDIEDYYRVAPEFGENRDLKHLVEAAHAKGVRVVLDAVFNHCSDRCAQFRDALKNGRRSKYFDWFIFRGEKPDTVDVNYECFASCKYMPKWNTSNEEVIEFLTDVAVYWIKEYDIDGWRLDVSDEVSHEFWRRMRRQVKAVKPDCILIGENWHDACSYLRGDQFDGIMNYAFTKACSDFFAEGAMDAAGMADRLNGILMRNTDTVNFMMLNLLDSHDTHRFLTRLGGDRRKLLSAFACAMFFPGIPSIYYGTEIAMEGGYDPDCRRTFDWSRAEDGDDFNAEFRRLVGLRGEESVKNGEARIRAEGPLLLIERFSDGEELSLCLNNTPAAAEYRGEVVPPFGYVVARRKQ